MPAACESSCEVLVSLALALGFPATSDVVEPIDVVEAARATDREFSFC